MKFQLKTRGCSCWRSVHLEILACEVTVRDVGLLEQIQVTNVQCHFSTLGDIHWVNRDRKRSKRTRVWDLCVPCDFKLETSFTRFCSRQSVCVDSSSSRHLGNNLWKSKNAKTLDVLHTSVCYIKVFLGRHWECLSPIPQNHLSVQSFTLTVGCY